MEGNDASIDRHGEAKEDMGEEALASSPDRDTPDGDHRDLGSQEGNMSPGQSLSHGRIRLRGAQIHPVEGGQGVHDVEDQDEPDGPPKTPQGSRVITHDSSSGWAFSPQEFLTTAEHHLSDVL